MFPEIHTYLVILKNVRYRFDIYIQPIPEGQRTANFEFYKGKGDLDFNIRSRRISGNSDVADYDLLLLEDHTLPILLETKMHRTPEENETDIALKLNRSIVPQRIDELFAPISLTYSQFVSKLRQLQIY